MPPCYTEWILCQLDGNIVAVLTNMLLIQFYMEYCGVSPPLPKDAPMGAPGYKPSAFDEAGEQTLWKDSLEMLKLGDD